MCAECGTDWPCPPFVQAAESANDPGAVESPGQWARDIAADYRHIAATSKYPPARSANEAEAAKYEAIAARLDRILDAGEES